MLRKCKIKDAQKAITAQKDVCIEVFASCRAAEDLSVSAVADCLLPPPTAEELTELADTLAHNGEAAAAALATVTQLATGTTTTAGTSTTTATGNRRIKRQVVTCSEVVTTSASLVLAINTNPAGDSIVTLSLEISSATSVECSAAEKASLLETATSLDTAIETINEALDKVLK